MPVEDTTAFATLRIVRFRHVDCLLEITKEDDRAICVFRDVLTYDFCHPILELFDFGFFRRIDLILVAVAGDYRISYMYLLAMRI